MMTHIHNSLFLQQNIHDKNTNQSITDLLKVLTPYMLSVNNKSVPVNLTVDTSAQSNIEKAIESSMDDNSIQNKADIISPRQEDSLFWCMYIAIHKYDEYLMIHNKHRTCELEWKQQLSTKINACQSTLKQSNHKVTKTNIQEILSDLMTSPFKTNLLCVIAITVYHNIQFIIMNQTNNMRLEFLTNTSNDVFVIYKNERNNYMINPEPLSNTALDQIRKNSYLIEHDDKPLKSIGSYKLDDLIEYAKLFGIFNEDEKYKKADLYEMVGMYISKYKLSI